MADLAATVASALADYYLMIQKQMHTWVDPLSTEQIWRRPYPYGNSIGHLLLHLTGNLNHYIGREIAGTGYVRDRDREFNDTGKRSKEDVLGDFDRVFDLVIATVQKQSVGDW